MKKLMKSVKINVIASDFIIIVVIYLLVLLMQTPAGFYIENHRNLIYIAMHYSKMELANMGEMMSAYSIIMNIRDFKWYVVLLPVLSTFIGAKVIFGNYVEGTYKFGVTRVGKKKYAILSMVEAIIYVVLVNVLAISLFSIIVYCFYPSGNDFDGLVEYSLFSLNSNNKLFSAFLLMVTNIILVSIIYMELTILIVVLVKDLFIGVSAPMVLTYLGYMALNLHLLKLTDEYGFDYPLERLKMEIINPAQLIMMELNYEIIFNKPQYVYFIGVIIVGVCLGIGVTYILTFQRCK